MAVSSAVSTALTDAATDGAAIAAAGLGFLVVLAGFKYARRAVADKEPPVEKGLVIDEPDEEIAGLVKDYVDERNAKGGHYESDGTYEHFYRNREAWEDIGEFVSEGGRHEYHDGEADNDADDSPAAPDVSPIAEERDHPGGTAANDSDYATALESFDQDEPDDEASEEGEEDEAEDEGEDGEELAAEPANRSAQG